MKFEIVYANVLMNYLLKQIGETWKNELISGNLVSHMSFIYF